jgi:hypothetical protein
MRGILIVAGAAALAYGADSYRYHGAYFAAFRNMLSLADSSQSKERALRAACNSIEARIELWDGILSKLRHMRAA